MSASGQAPGGVGTLLLLWRLKLKGRMRLLGRRARTPVGALTVLAGLALFGLWVGSIALRSSMLERTGEPPGEGIVRLGLAAYLVFIAFSSLSFRGVYLPRPELERLLAGPIEPSSIVRYRILGAVTMSLPFMLLMGLLIAPRFASPTAAVFAILLIVPTTTALGQGVSLVAARTSGPLHRLLERVSPTVLRLAGALGLGGLLFFLAFGPGVVEPGELERRAAVERALRGDESFSVPIAFEPPPTPGERIAAAAEHPVVRTITTPLAPWARAITAPSLGAALPWLAAVLGLLVLCFEAVARFPVDFRETSLRTSRELERRLARVRKGQGGVAAFQGDAATRRGDVPWFAGRGPFGAVVWLRTAWLLRQAQGTLLVSALVAIGGIIMGTRVFGDSIAESVALAVLGVVYLASGLRVDLRADLDRMEVLKAWPLPPWKLFAASLIPGTLLTSLVIAVVLVARAAILDLWSVSLPVLIGCIPPLAFAWIAVDNAVFLLFPVRFVPGQGSAIQHAGRTFLLVLLRASLFGALLLSALGGAWFLTEWGQAAGLSEVALWSLVIGWIAGIVVLGFAALLAFGAWALRRFDVSRVPAAG